MLVSICLPTFNRSNSLKKAIKNILAQSFSEIEILISDNCSTDETFSFCQTLIKENEKIKYFRQLFLICLNFGRKNKELNRCSTLKKVESLSKILKIKIT